MNEHEQRLRDALAAGPTPGPWSASMVPHGASVESAATAPVAWCGTCSSSAPGGSVSRLRAHATARYIAAASPETVAALLAELHEANEANEAFGRRQAWWNERMFALEQERDALARWKTTHAPRLEALEALLSDAQQEAAAGREARATLDSERAANATLTDERDALAAEIERLRAFHDFFRDRCELLFFHFGMEAINLYNAAARKEAE